MAPQRAPGFLFVLVAVFVVDAETSGESVAFLQYMVAYCCKPQLHAGKRLRKAQACKASAYSHH